MTKPDIEASYALSPVQEGMLFHSLYSPHSGVYVQQMVGELREELDISAFRLAWQRIVEQHGILRTSFCLEGHEEPLQTVHQFVQLPFEEQDWREMSGPEQEQGLQDYLAADRRRGFDLTQAPLVRLALFRWKDADYRLVWTSHHALLDGRSRLLLLEELFAFYEAAFRGGDLQLKAPRPFKDYIDWLGKQDFNSSEGFWRKMFEGAIMPTPIGISKAQVGGPDSEERSGNQVIRFSRRRTLELRKLTEEHQVTLNTLLQGVWALLLSGYSGKEEVVFGVTRACRKSALEGAESMVGILINTLPVRVQVSPDNLLLPWLKQLRAQWIAVREHEHTPLFKVQQWAEMDPVQPLFESLLVFENYELNTSLRKRAKSFEKRRFRLVGRTNYPLTIRGCLERGLQLEITYDRQRFDDATIARLLGQFETMLEEIVSNPWRRICDLSILTKKERHQLLVGWNSTKRGYPKDRCFHQLFEEQVKRTPEAVAVIFEGHRMTYRELNQRANQLAHYLRKLGVGPEVLVGICVERSLEMVIGLLGILKAGGAYVPLDPNYPLERLAFIVGDIQAAVLLTQQSLGRRLPDIGVKVVCLDREWGAIALQKKQNPVCRTLPEQLAYVMYTSGSTGNPKGVMIEHTSLINYLSWVNQSLVSGNVECIPLVSGLSFDASLKQLWAPLLRGSEIWIVSQDTATQPAALARALEGRTRVAFNCVPSLWESIIDAVHSGQATIPEESLTGLLLGGERLSKELVEKSLEVLPQVAIWNLYGPTEITANASAVRISSAEDLTIGRPIANTQIYLLDSHQNPVPIGAVGELYVGGVGLARGYHHRPELTAERFVPHPFSEEAGARLYRTGDLARYAADGNIHFLGRMDHQVKIRGYRIEPGEIEAALEEHPAVRQAVVLAREDRPGENRLVAYAVRKPGQSATVRELRDFIKQRLPDYMVPASFVFLDRLPLTPNGKVDRKALPAPEPGRSGLERGFVAPRTPIEEVLASIWAEVLKRDGVGVQDNFFELGGHSLLATRMMSRVREAFQVEVPLRSLFEAPTVAGLAEAIEVLRQDRPGGAAAPILPVPRQEALPLSFAQQRLWFLDQFEPGSCTYNMPFAIRLTGELKVAALEQSLEEIIRRHEALRTTFVTENDEPIQIITPMTSFVLPVEDLTAVPAEQREAEARKRAQAEAL